MLVIVLQLEAKYSSSTPRSAYPSKERSAIQELSLAFEQVEFAKPGFSEQFLGEVLARLAPSSTNTGGLSRRLLP